MNRSLLTITFSLGLVFVVLIQSSQADNFVQSPSNITTLDGSVAEFRCQHQSIDAVISWLVNGSSPARFPDVTRIDSGSVSTLTILSVLEHDGIEVVCEAFIRSGGSPVFEQTSPAILTVIAVEPMTTATETTTTMEPVTSTAEAKTTTAETTTTAVQVQSTTETMEPTTTTVTTTSFPTVPSPQVLIVTMEERHVYMCNHSETVNVFWRVNGSRLNVEIFPSEINPVILTLSDGGRVYTLEIGGRLEHNATTIQCSARLSDGSEVTTPSVLFFIQGPLQSVDNLERKNTTISWEAPFSLNLTNVEPDIVYCVEVYNITCGGRELLISDCDVMETSYTSDVLQAGYIYEYMVTPRSNVEGAQNGTSKTVTEQFMDLQSSTRGYRFSFVSDTESRYSIENLKTRIHLDNMDQEQTYVIDAASYSLSLNPLDGFEEEPLLMSTYAVRNGISIMLKVSLQYRRLWNYTVLAYDCEEHPLLEINELSTHDIQNISVTSPQPGEVIVTGDFIDGSTATGLLTIIVISTSEIVYHLIERGSDHLHIEGSIQGVVGGEHSISFFVVEESGLPFNRTASTPKVVSVEHGSDVNQPSIEYSLQSTSTGVCITCTFLEDSVTECVVVVHKHINSLPLMRIEANLYNFTRSGDTASGCIEEVNMEDYQVGVVGGKIATSATTNPTNIPVTRSTSIVYIIVGIVLGVFLGVLLPVIGIIVIILLWKRRQKKSAHQTALPPESPLPKPTNNYETVLPLGTGVAGVHEGTPLFRVQSDGPTARQTDDSAHAHDTTPTSTSPPPYSPPEREGDSTLPPPVPPPRTKEDPNVVAYAETVVSKCATAPPPTEADKVVYQEVGGTLNAEGQHYTLISDLPTRTSVIPDDLHKTVYSEIKPQDPSSCQVTIAEKNGSEKQSSPKREDTSSTPFSLEHILPEVIPIASKWQALGEALSLDEDLLDEIFTNNETEEACLHVMLEHYMERSDLKHSWEELETAMKKVKEAQDKDASTKDSSPPIPPRDITGQMLYHSSSSQHNYNDDYKSSFEEKIVQSDDSCRVDKDEGQFTSGRPGTTTVHSEKSPVNDDRSCQVTCCCSEESFRPLQRALQQPLTFTSSVQQDAKDSGLNDPNTHQPVVPDQCHNDHESFQKKCDREQKDEGYSSSTLDGSEDSSYPESECVLPIQETQQGHPLEQLIVQGPLVILQPESLDHLRCHYKQSIECEQLHNIVSVQHHQY